MGVLLTIVGLAVGVPAVFWAEYNFLIKLENKLDKMMRFVAIEVEYWEKAKPELEIVAKTFLNHERDTLQSVTQARRQFGKAADITGKSAAYNDMVKAFVRVAAVVESYPELKSEPITRRWQEVTLQAHRKIVEAEKSYEEARNLYNDVVERFPTKNLVAGRFGFTKLG